MTAPKKNELWFHERSCLTKRPYRLRSTAKDVLQQARKQGRLEGCAVYQCRFCHHFHIGHPRKRQ